MHVTSTQLWALQVCLAMAPSSTGLICLVKLDSVYRSFIQTQTTKALVIHISAPILLLTSTAEPPTLSLSMQRSDNRQGSSCERLRFACVQPMTLCL